MTPERWQVVTDTFEKVFFDTPSEARASELARMCAGDSELESEVRRLIDSAESQGPLDEPIVLGSAALGGTLRDSRFGFLPGRVLSDRFRLVRLLGEGGMGQVWEAFDEQLGVPRAIKTLRPEIARDSPMITRFKREVERSQAVTHSNVCRVYDLRHDGETPYLSMELLEGETLAARLRRQDPIGEAEALQILRHCGSAVDAAHAVGLVHRDLKPSNVMLVREGNSFRAVVMDFGLATPAVTTPTDVSLRGAGTPAYMAPEQAAGAGVLPASDMYAFGVLACELLTRKRPYEGGLERLSPRRRRVLRQCIEPDPSRRPESCLAVVSRLDVNWWNLPSLWGMVTVVLLLLSGWLVHSIRPTRAPSEISIAVLPFQFENGADPEATAEGITDGIVALLARTSHLRVVPRATAERYDPARLRLEEFARQAHTQYLVMGRVRAGERSVHVSAQLVEPAANRTLWAGTFEQPEQDLPQLEHKLAVVVLAQIGVQSSISETLGRRTTLEAGRAYRLGRHHLGRRTSEALRKAREYFETAIRLDPLWAEPRVGLAEVLLTMAERRDEAPQTALPAAREMLERALALDGGMAEAHSAAGLLASVYDHDFAAAESSFQRAIALEPNNVTARQWHSYSLLKQARFREATQESEYAMQLDPLSIPAHRSHTDILFYTRDYDALLTHLERLIELDPTSYFYRILRAYAFASTGRPDAARAELKLAMAGNVTPLVLRLAGEVEMLLGDKLEAARFARQLEDLRRSGGAVPSSYIAFLYAAMGEEDAAFDWMERAWAEGDTFLSLLRVYPACDRLRGDPRYQSLLSRLGLKGNTEAGSVPAR